MTAVFGLMLLSACGGSGTATTPTRPATTSAATAAPTAQPAATPAPTEAPLETPQDTSGPLDTPPVETAPGGTGAAVDYCGLLTVDQIGAAFNEQVGGPQPDTNSCGWSPQDPNSTKTLVIEGLTVSDFQELKGITTPGITNTHVTGVGDDAFVQTLNDTTPALYVLKGPAAFELLVAAPDMAANDVASLEVTLGKEAVVNFLLCRC